MDNKELLIKIINEKNKTFRQSTSTVHIDKLVVEYARKQAAKQHIPLGKYVAKCILEYKEE